MSKAGGDFRHHVLHARILCRVGRKTLTQSIHFYNAGRVYSGSVYLSHLFSNFNRARGACWTWLTVKMYDRLIMKNAKLDETLLNHLTLIVDEKRFKKIICCIIMRNRW